MSTASLQFLATAYETTDEAGNNVFPDVVPGDYNVRISQDGFETLQVTGLHVVVGQRATVDVALDVGQVTNVIMVEAGAMQLETTSNAIGTVVDSERLNELPLNGRNFLGPPEPTKRSAGRTPPGRWGIRAAAR